MRCGCWGRLGLRFSGRGDDVPAPVVTNDRSGSPSRSRTEQALRMADRSGLTRILRRLPTWRGVVILGYHRIGDPLDSELDHGLFSASAARATGARGPGHQVAALPRETLGRQGDVAAHEHRAGVKATLGNRRVGRIADAEGTAVRPTVHPVISGQRAAPQGGRAHQHMTVSHAPQKIAVMPQPLVGRCAAAHSRLRGAPQSACFVAAPSPWLYSWRRTQTPACAAHAAHAAVSSLDTSSMTRTSAGLAGV